MKTRKYNLSSLYASSVILPDEKDDSRIYVFPCECGEHDHSVVVSYIHTQEEDPSNISLYISQPIKSTQMNRRWGLAYKYLTKQNAPMGMGAETCLSTYSIKNLIQIIESFIKFMEDNFLKRELSQVETNQMHLCLSLFDRKSKLRRYGKPTETISYTDVILVADSTDNSISLTPGDSRYLFWMCLSMLNTGWSSWSISWTLSKNFGFFRRLWWTTQYMMGRESRHTREGYLELKYHEAIMFLSSLEKIVDFENEFQTKPAFLQV